jgi:flagellar biosynthetic protein FliQ
MIMFFADEFFTDAYVMEISTQALYLILLLSAPMLMAALGVGLVISILQATTQVQEQTLSFVPKLIATFVSVVVCGTWISSMVGGFATRIFTDISQMGPKPYFDRNYNKRKQQQQGGPKSPESYLKRGYITMNELRNLS